MTDDKEMLDVCENLDEATADVHFVLISSDNQIDRVPAHKVKLTEKSEVFRAMFSGAWQEKDEVTISETSATVFKQFLQFFYQDEVELSTEHVIEIIDLAERYNVGNCSKACERFMEDNLTVENICAAYSLATVYNFAELKRLCDANIIRNTGSILKTKGFMECNYNVLRHIFELDVLSCTETTVFHACMSWVKAKNAGTLTKDAIQNQLGELFYTIRFGSMKLKEFVSVLNSMTSLPAEEFKGIIEMIISTNFLRVPKRTHLSTFSSYIGCCRETDFDRFHEHLFDDIFSITFSVNTNSLLIGISCGRIERWGDLYSDEEHDWICSLSIFEVRDSAQGDSDDHGDALLYSDDDCTLVADDSEIFLEEPIIIRRGLKYQINIELGTEYTDFPIFARKLYTSNVSQMDEVLVEIHDDTKDGRRKASLIEELRFAKI